MLRYQGAREDGGFIAQGLGLRYEYDRGKNALHFSVVGEKEMLFDLICPSRIMDNPQLFIHNIEKAACIKALMLSNNETANIARALHEQRLKPIVENIFELAVQSYDLGHGHFDDFTSRKLNGFGLEDFQIKHMNCSRSGTSYYRLFIKISDGQDIVVRETEIDILLTKAAQIIVRDLIPQTFGTARRHMADNLLTLSSRLSLLGRILNENYHPELQAKGEKKISKEMKSTS